MLTFDLDVVTTVVYHLRFELAFSAVLALVLLLSPDAWTKVRGGQKSKGKPQKVEAPKDPVALAGHIIELSGSRYSKAMDLFTQNDPAMDAVPSADLTKVVTALSIASVRVGRADRLPLLFRRLRDDKGQVLVHVMRLLASRQQYNEALTAMGEWRSCASEPVPAMAASCLVQCAVESRKVPAAEEMFQMLHARGEAAARDYSAMIRLYAATAQADCAKQVLADMRTAGLEPDNVAYNMVLGACANAGNGDDDFAKQMSSADVVTYNTRLKACARTKDITRGFQVYEELVASGLTPTQVTYGTLLEVCSRAGDLAKARSVLTLMDEANVKRNNIVYTSMIKCLVGAGQLRQAMEVFTELRNEPDLTADVIAFSVLIKAHCDQGALATALELLEELLQQGHCPDEILFNNLLAGCAAAPNVALGEKLMADMVSHSIRPTMATFSILLKMYSKAGSFAQSAQLLQRMPEEYGVVPAPRLYVQHISWCIRLRRGASALQVYKLMLERCPGPVEVDLFLTACASFNMLDTAVALIDIDISRFSARTVRELHAVLLRKKPNLAAKVDLNNLKD